MLKLPAVVLVLASAQVAHAETKKPTVTLGTPRATIGSADAKATTAVMKPASAKVLACYKEALAAQRVSGIATASIKVGIDGKPTSVAVTGLVSAAEAPVHNCIAEVITKLTFAKPKNGEVVEIAFPMTFSLGDLDDVYGGLLGNEVGEMTGGFGFSGGGTVVGGGTGWGTIGTGRYGTIGYGSGFGPGTSTVPAISIGQPKTTGGDLDKAIIRRYVKRNIQKLQYCYEKELLKSPKLQGTVVAEFTIAVDGKVTISTASGLKNANVETCLADVINNIEFPKPKAPAAGGAATEVMVSYPLTFRLPPPPPAKKPPAKKK